jgi:hypothetical protein
MLLSCILKIYIQVLNNIYMYPYHQVLDKTFHHHQTLKMDLKPFTIKSLYELFEVYFFSLLWMVQQGCFLGSRNHSFMDLNNNTRQPRKIAHTADCTLCAWYSLLKDKAKFIFHLAPGTNYHSQWQACTIYIYQVTKTLNGLCFVLRHLVFVPTLVAHQT